MLLADGTIQAEIYNSIPNVPFANSSIVVIPPVEGYLLSCVAQLTATIDGSNWLWLRSFKGVVPTPIVTLPPGSGMLIAQGEIDHQSFIAWPNSLPTEAGTGAGRMRNIMLAPAAGANWTLQTSSHQRWEVLGVSALLRTSAAAGTRQASLLLYDRLGNAIMRYPTNFTQAAGLAYGYYFYTGATHMQTNAIWITAPLPTTLFLDPLMSLQSAVQNMDGGDAWQNVSCLVREWMGVGHA